ncbi:GSCFA domain-containing protein [Hymenobacter sp. GOD-10R]|uniref:GSCFA domain-containing protein n=1 Tax=Hymenobacter sp. GOD-10R TaxID=3093922 RepID=UPI002D77B6DC|nr:GSCFA domain-containing protein [Hymenobacter sp. GOD-10R]WRQ29819.1 GSCFA domain-containing protein [Hymenobacter sp. GOD-10R]
MFRTEIPFTAHPHPLPASARILTVGSCFSDTIGGRLADAKVQTLVNPFGTVFNPLSACKLLRAAAGEEVDWQQHVVEARGRWQSYDLHASIGADSPVDLLQHIQTLVQQTGDFLRTADVVVLTLGSAFVYRLLETQELVSNCHKIPAERFEKELLTPDEIINAVAETHAFLRLQNPKLRFILTVSPVRHLKDTLPLNAVSKSVLRVACHYLSELLMDVAYFPAYELLLDDLRDYRFYAADMLHPSEVAENYIWERFTRTYFDVDFGRFQKEWSSVQQALAHRPLHPAAPEHRQFLENTLTRLQRLSTQADLRAEIREIEQRLRALPVPKPTVVPEPEDDNEERIDIGQPQSESLAHVTISEEVDIITALDDVETTTIDKEAPEEVQDSEEEVASLPAKKKRRSRGGAKRTARKKAAQLAALAATELELPSTEDLTAEANALDLTPEPVEISAPDQQHSTEDLPISPPEPDSAELDNESVTSSEESELPLASGDNNLEEPTVPEPIESTPAPPKARKGRTAGQILKAKSGRKSAKAAANTTAKVARPSSTRTSRRKPSVEAAPAVETPAPALSPESAPEPQPVEVTNAPVAATKRRGRPPRKQPTKTDKTTPNT